MWNPPFFGRQTIEANIVDNIIVNRFDLSGNSQDRQRAVSLGKVRALSGRSRRVSLLAASWKQLELVLGRIQCVAAKVHRIFAAKT